MNFINNPSKNPTQPAIISAHPQDFKVAPSYIKATMLLGFIVFLLDQVSKMWIVAHYALFDSTPITSFFNIVRLHNKGAAFSFLADASGWQHYFFIGLGIAMSGYLVVLMRQTPYLARLCTAYGLIICGAWGNIADRLRLGYVVDFLDVHLGHSHWPAFNIADSAICIGMALWILDEVLKVLKSYQN